MSYIRFIIYSLILANVHCHWLTPCGFVYTKEEEFVASGIFPRNNIHDLKHLLQKVSQLLATLQINIVYGLEYGENWIPEAKNLLRYYDLYGRPSKLQILKHILPEAFRNLEIFAFALQANLDNMKHYQDDKNPDISKILNNIIKRNAEIICHTDLIMRKYEVEFESISNEFEEYKIPVEWMNVAQSTDKTHRVILRNEVFFKYQQFIQTLRRILSE